MGIKGLWTFLTPFCERKSLYELQGKTLAIDLSGWVCEAISVVDQFIQPHFYLRNLFFRTVILLQMDVKPVFVLEGKAPIIKHDTIAQRNVLQFKNRACNTNGKVKKGSDRTRFNHVLKCCEEFLNYMGLICIKSWGEAEAMCAYLNSHNLVDGCVSQDSDCFAYGAQIVYRNFSISHQGSVAASGGAVDVYDLSKIPQSLDFGRNKMIVLALLCGCDYNEDGIPGVGKESVIKLLNKFKNEDILNQVTNWRNDTSKFEELEKKVNDKKLCSSCGHLGRVQEHNRKGCSLCYPNTCSSSTYKEERIAMKNEIQIRMKALQDKEFPNRSIIDEFLNQNHHIPDLDLSWKMPNLIQLVRFAYKKLDWKEVYAMEKFLPLLTRWQLKNYKSISSETKGLLTPIHIVKKRTLKSIPSYEILWSDKDHYYDGLIPQVQIDELAKMSSEEEVNQQLWTTIEPQCLVDLAYSDLAHEFNQSKEKAKSKSSKRTKNKENDINAMFQRLSIAEDRSPQKKIPKKNQMTLEKFVLLKKTENQEKIHLPSASYEKYLDLNETNVSLFQDDCDLNISDIIERVTTQKSTIDL